MAAAIRSRLPIVRVFLLPYLVVLLLFDTVTYRSGISLALLPGKTGAIGTPYPWPAANRGPGHDLRNPLASFRANLSSLRIILRKEKTS